MEVSCSRRSIYFFLFFVLATLPALAEKGESSRILVHTLNYIGNDYQFAVSDGKVLNQQEYKEAQEFGQAAVKYFNEYSGSWKNEDSLAIRSLIYRLDSLISVQSSFAEVSAVALSAKAKVIAASGLTVTPSKYPNLENAKLLYRSSCQRCHGASGNGDGPDGLVLTPKPGNFNDESRMISISPFAAFNTIRLGVAGTGMSAHPELNDEEVWDLAFYILSIRYEKYKGSAALQEMKVKAFVDSLSLEKIATTADASFETALPPTESATYLAALRLNQPEVTGNGFLKTTVRLLDEAMELYRQGKYKEATQKATLSYLEGIEPVEMQLKASDPQLMSKLELQMGLVRRLMAQHKPVQEVEVSVNAAKESIQAVTEILENKEYSFVLAFTMALSILMREGLEAFLIIMVILSILKASDLKNAIAWVHGGWVAAVITGIILWLAGGTLLKQQKLNAELTEGVISLFAVGMLLYIGFWLHGKSEMNKWKEYVTKLLKGATSSGSLLSLSAISFFVVFREVFESVLFLTALDIESGGKQTNAIALGVVSAFVLVTVLALVVLRFSARLPISKLFKFSSIVMGMLAVVLAGKGIHSLQEIGVVAVHGITMFRVELIGIFPTLETTLAQAVILIVVLVMLNITTFSKKK